MTRRKCQHHFIIPTPPEPALGVCKLCGKKRMHLHYLPDVSNGHRVNNNVWSKSQTNKRDISKGVTE